MTYPIARELLADALERLEWDHYSDGLSPDCDDCQRATDIRRELLDLGEEVGI